MGRWLRWFNCRRFGGELDFSGTQAQGDADSTKVAVESLKRLKPILGVHFDIFLSFLLCRVQAWNVYDWVWSWSVFMLLLSWWGMSCGAWDDVWCISCIDSGHVMIIRAVDGLGARLGARLEGRRSDRIAGLGPASG